MDTCLHALVNGADVIHTAYGYGLQYAEIQCVSTVRGRLAPTGAAHMTYRLAGRSLL